jgi:hypothetical protein
VHKLRERSRPPSTLIGLVLPFALPVALAVLLTWPANGDAQTPASILRVSPNPFSESLTIELSLRALPWTTPGYTLQIFDRRGVLIRTLNEPGSQTSSITWDGRSDKGLRVASGMYWLLFRADAYRVVRPVLLVH